MDKKHILIPAAIFAAFALLYISISLINDNNFLFRPVWDIDHYRTIAEEGYEIYPCKEGVHYPLGDLCGNVGWFPAWPLAVKILSLGQVNAGLIILPYLFSLLGFILFYNLLLRWADARAAVVGTAALAATPSAFFFLTGFPYGFILFLFTGYLYYLYRPEARGRRYLLPLGAFIISLSYPSAFMTAVIPCIMLINEYRAKGRPVKASKIIGDVAYYILPFAMGPLVLSLYFYVTFDDFLLILHFQEKYHRQWDFPLAVIWKSMLQFPALYVENCSTLYYGLVFLIFAPYRIKSELVGYFLLFFLFSPATGSITSVYRHYLLLFPATMIVGLSARPLWVKVVFIALGLIIALLRFFPIFLDARLI